MGLACQPIFHADGSEHRGFRINSTANPFQPVLLLEVRTSLVHVAAVLAGIEAPAHDLRGLHASRAREAMALLEHWNLGVLLRGLVRRDEILRRRLTVRHNHGDVASAHRAR